MRRGHVERCCGGLLHKYGPKRRRTPPGSLGPVQNIDSLNISVMRLAYVSRLCCWYLQLCDVGHLGCDLHSYGTVHNDAPDDVRSDLTLTRVHLRFVRIPQSECAAGTSSNTVGATSSAVCVGTSLPKSGQRMVSRPHAHFLGPAVSTTPRAHAFPPFVVGPCVHVLREQLARLAPSARQLGPRPARVRRRCCFALDARAIGECALM